MMDFCKYGECRKQSVYYLVYTCDHQHIADLKVCIQHLAAIKRLVDERKFRCATCQYPLTRGIYRHIKPTAKRIITRNLHGEVIKNVPNSDHTDLTQAFERMRQQAEITTIQMRKITEAVEAMKPNDH